MTQKEQNFSIISVDKYRVAMLYHCGISGINLPRQLHLLSPTINHNLDIQQKIDYPSYINPITPDIQYDPKRKLLYIYERTFQSLYSVNIESEKWSIIQMNIWGPRLVSEFFSKLLIDYVSNELYLIGCTTHKFNKLFSSSDTKLRIYKFNDKCKRFKFLYETNENATDSRGRKLDIKVYPFYKNIRGEISDVLFLVHVGYMKYLSYIKKYNLINGSKQDIYYDSPGSDLITLRNNAMIKVNIYDEEIIYTQYLLSSKNANSNSYSLNESDSQLTKKWTQHNDNKLLIDIETSRSFLIENIWEDQLVVSGYCRVIAKDNDYHFTIPLCLIAIISQYFSIEYILSYAFYKATYNTSYIHKLGQLTDDKKSESELTDDKKLIIYNNDSMCVQLIKVDEIFENK